MELEKKKKKNEKCLPEVVTLPPVLLGRYVELRRGIGTGVNTNKGLADERGMILRDVAGRVFTRCGLVLVPMFFFFFEKKNAKLKKGNFMWKKKFEKKKFEKKKFGKKKKIREKKIREKNRPKKEKNPTLRYQRVQLCQAQLQGGSSGAYPWRVASRS